MSKNKTNSRNSYYNSIVLTCNYQYMKYSFLLLLLSSLIYTNCTTSGKMTAVSGIEKVNDFDQYWYQSKAEITSYKLEQSRYGETLDMLNLE